MRINKLFSNYGICSRKAANKLIEENSEYFKLLGSYKLVSS